MNPGTYAHPFNWGHIFRGSWSRAPRTLVWFLVLYLFDLMIIPVLHGLGDGLSDFLIGIVAGVGVGQCAILAIVCGLYGTTWIDGFLLGGFAFLIGFGLFAVGATFTAGEIANDGEWILFGYIPGVMLSIFAPLLAMRHFASWRIVDPNKVYPRKNVALGSIFLNTAVIAMIVIAVRAPQVMFAGSATAYWTSCIATGLVMFVLSMAVTVPLAAFVLNCDNAPRRLVRLACSGGVALCVFLVCMVVIGVSVNEPIPAELFFGAIVATASAIVVVHLGIEAIHRDGFRLRTNHNTLGQRTQPKTEAQKAIAQQYLVSHRKRTILRVTFVLLLAIGLNAYLSLVHSKEARYDRSIDYLKRIVASQGGAVYELPNRQFSLTLGKSSQLYQVQNAIFQRQLQASLAAVDLSAFDYMPISLHGFTNLKKANISNKAVAGTHFASIGTAPLDQLVAKDCFLDSSNWIHVRPELKVLHLDRSILQTVSFTDFLRQSEVKDLSLNDVRLQGTEPEQEDLLSLLTEREWTKLCVAGISFTDRHVQDLVSSRFDLLDLSRTDITDAAMQRLSDRLSSSSTLRLAETRITDAGVAKLIEKAFDVLDLSGTDVTGKAFQGWRQLPKFELNLANTRVGDELVETFAQLQTPANSECTINLRGTMISNDVMPTLARVPCQTIDVSNTAVNANGFKAVQNEPTIVKRWRVADGQLSNEEIQSLEASGVALEVRADSPRVLK